ncbi:hypothetical protein FIV06_15790 [Labrenzia sp. THAF191b]|uniref:phage tail tip lysozyme n=1 Tax=unclassified Labrenzia TaxID=2648686 RepID=UPI0012690D04|nr:MULTISPECIES: phage tail tip lysozyme [unclassified Labrenzia]QFS98890.1 hypothetical protein FIV06_15790 [Labrenzia sp. THAF191b]QFT05204.1 hypothetical protein FIV05_15785 [Labrenzia sp. THAF191a]QFT16748.1 hypothetical protein FIV03_15800 [Labrenzia sp. THAF187b]
MSNRQRQQVGYRQFRPQGTKADGLLAVSREGGDMERRVAAGFARLAGQFGQMADRQAAIEGERAGIRAALAGAPQAGMITGGSAARGIVVGEKDSNETAAAARDYLIQKHGLQPHQAAAIAGHGMQESGFNLKAVGDNGTAHGAFQHRGDRLVNGKRYAASSGRSWDSLEAQLDFVMHELATSESYAGNALRAATNLDEAVAAFMHFERPAGYTRANPTAGHGYTSRLAYAKGLSGIAIDDAARDGPMRVTPIGEAVPVRAGAPGTFRPTGSATIRGRAYDVAGTRTYLQQLDVTMQQDMAAVYDAYSEDPAMLQKALGELKTAHLQDHVFDEIAGDYSAVYDKKSLNMLERSREAAKIRQEQKDREEFLGRIDTLEEEKARFLAGQNAGSEADADDLFSIQGSIDEHYDNAVSRGILTQAEADRYKASSMRDTSVAFYLGQADGKSSDEIVEMRQQIAKDYSEGKLENVDRESWARIDGGLEKLSKDRTTAERQASDNLRRQGDEFALRIVDGASISEAEYARFERGLGVSPEAEAIGQSALRRLNVARHLRTNPPGVVRQNLAEILKGPDGSVNREDLTFARDLIARQEKALETDPLALAERYGAVPLVPGLLDAMQTGGAISAVKGRVDTAHAVAERFGVAPKYFTGTEKVEIAELIRTEPDTSLGLIAGIVEAGGAASVDMLRELREAAPEAEWAGVVLALGGNPRAAQDALLGNQPGVDGKRPPNPVKKQRQAVTSEVLGGALSQLHPEDSSRVEESAMSIARRQAEVAGVAPDSPEAEEIYRRALNEAAGAVFSPDGQRGGFAEINGRTVLLPPGMTAENVEDLLEGMSEQDLEAISAPLSPLGEFGVKVTADDIRDGVLFAVAPGAYRIGKERGGRMEFVADPAGGFWELDLARLAELQRQRLSPNFGAGGGGF